MRPQSMQQTLLQIAPANALALSLSFTHTHTHSHMLYPWTLLFAHQRFAKARCVLRFEHFQASSAPPFRPAAPRPLLCISLHGCVCVLVLFYCMLSGAATYRFTIEKYTLAFFRQFSQNCSECISLFLFFLLFGPASFLYIFNVLLPSFGVFGAWHIYISWRISFNTLRLRPQKCVSIGTAVNLKACVDKKIKWNYPFNLFAVGSVISI